MHTHTVDCARACNARHRRPHGMHAGLPRPLTPAEIALVSGGIGPGGAALGAIGNGIVTASMGGTPAEIFTSAAIGGVSGFFGGIAVSGGSKFIGTMFGGKAVALQWTNGRIVQH